MNEIILITVLDILLFTTGFLLGRITSEYDNIIYTTKKSLKEKIDVYEKEAKNTFSLSQSDLINHEGVGIVMRPTIEELKKMNEPQKEREAKEAVAELIRNTPEPTI